MFRSHAHILRHVTVQGLHVLPVDVPFPLYLGLELLSFLQVPLDERLFLRFVPDMGLVGFPLVLSSDLPVAPGQLLPQAAQPLGKTRSTFVRLLDPALFLSLPERLPFALLSAGHIPPVERQPVAAAGEAAFCRADIWRSSG